LDTLFDRSAAADVIITLGGDGTARAVAGRAPPDAAPLIILPGGTLNMLPKALYGDLSWPDALDAALTRGTIMRLAGGSANGEPFFVAATFGAPALLARVREAAREGRFLSAMRRFRHFIARSFARKISGRPEGARMKNSEAVAVLCSSFPGATGDCDLEWVGLDAAGFADLARVAARAMTPGWRDDPAIEAQRCKRGEVRGRGVIPATLDGEPCTFVSHVRITCLAQGPQVVAVRPAQDLA
jgi:diacylglycerol kinase family enzyme